MPVRAVAAAALLVLALTGCELTARFDTTVRPDGTGELTVSVLLDRELRDQLALSDGGPTELQALFDGLATRGWRTASSEPDGGLALQATRAFADPEGYQAALQEVREVRAGGADSFGIEGLRFDFRYRVEPAFGRTRTTFEGSFDTSAGLEGEAVRDFIEAIGDSVHLEVRAHLPGSVRSRDAGATVSDGALTWRPRLGEAVTLSASANALRPAPVLAVAVPVLFLLALGGWLGTRRRVRRSSTRPLETIVLEPAAGNGNGNGHHTIVLEEEADEPTR